MGAPVRYRYLAEPSARPFYGTQYEIRVDYWPRHLRKAAWRAIVRGEEAERLVGEIAEAITSGAWTPGNGDPPVAYTRRESQSKGHEA